MLKILIFSDLPQPSGFGRISTYLARYLSFRGHDVRGAGLFYNGDPCGLPFHIWPLVGQDIWGRLTQIINVGVGDGWIPDLVFAIQDFPYLISLFRDCPVDWSNKKCIGITPIDGFPIFREWEAVSRIADAMMVISRFGVEAMRQQGVRVDLCHPGVDSAEFWPATPEEKNELRARAGIPPSAWIYGMFSMNQGRKAIPDTMKGFLEFSKDKPNTLLYLDMDEVSPAGWHIGMLAESIGLPTQKLFHRKQLQPVLPNIRDRYAILDAHGVLSYREGFGLPLLESMACRIPTFAQDWCSGTEVVGDGRGYLVDVARDRGGNRILTPGTWGNAQDAIPDIKHFAELLNQCYEHPIEAQAIAEKGYLWAKQQTWEAMGKQVEEVIGRIYGPGAFSRDSRIHQDIRPGIDSGGLRGQPSSDMRPSTGGDSSGGRWEPAPTGVDPNSEALSHNQNSPGSEDVGVRSELQPWGEGSNGPLVSLPELGHGSLPELERRDDGGDGKAPKRRPRPKASISP